ncbi:MAG: hypothetical protein R3F53_00225 [Gammaproteobacteria bacterium]
MTMGIAAAGPHAGLAIFQALRAAEKIGWGSIGGFASFAVITEDNRLLRYQTQRGGSSTLFIDGDRTGAEPPSEVLKAPLAALMSSGPDRPEPLSQFVPGAATAGLVTGHRLPNTPGRNGKILNLDVLHHLQQGKSPQQAIDSVLADNPQADAGLIALNRQGQIYARNSERVQQRPDLGWARREHPNCKGAVVEILHNAIYPNASLAHVVAGGIALETMVPTFHPDRSVAEAGPVQLGTRDHRCGDGLARGHRTSDHTTARQQQWLKAIYIGSEGLAREQRFTGLRVVLEQGHIIAQWPVLTADQVSHRLTSAYFCIIHSLLITLIPHPSFPRRRKSRNLTRSSSVSQTPCYV